MSLLDKVKEFAESEEVQKGIQRVKENTEEILSEENINKVLIVQKKQHILFLNQKHFKRPKMALKK